MVGRLGIEVGSMGEQPLRARGYMERRAAFGVRLSCTLVKLSALLIDICYASLQFCIL